VAFLKQLQLRWKLMIMLSIPIVGLILFSVDKIGSTTRLLDDTKKVNDLAELSVKASALVHELQKERGLSAGYLGSKGSKFVNELPEQRNTTDSKVSALTTYLNGMDKEYGPEFNNTLQAALSNLGKLETIRNDISKQNTELKNAIGYYSNTNARFIDLISTLPKLSSLGAINNAASAYVNFILSKERAGIERAVLAATFSSDKFAPGMLYKFQSLVTEQSTYLNVFTSLATAEQKKEFSALFDKKAFIETARMRSIAMDKADDGNFSTDPKYWFDTQTEKINLLKQFEDKLSSHLTGLAVTTEKTTKNSLYLSLASAMASIFAGILVAWLFTKIILGQLGGDPEYLRSLTDEIAHGNLDVEFKQTGKPFAGVLASMKTMRNNLCERIESDRRAAAENGRIKQALDNVTANVMIADRDNAIIYVNPSLAAYLKQSSTDIQQSLNGFDTSNPTGYRICDLFENGARLINSLKETHLSDIQFGNTHVRLFASPVIDMEGNRQGTVIEWVDRYEEAVSELILMIKVVLSKISVKELTS